jgi:hypothetical protein
MSLSETSSAKTCWPRVAMVLEFRNPQMFGLITGMSMNLVLQFISSC